MTLTIALIGVGYWGKNYLRLLGELGNLFELSAVVDTNQEALTKLKKKFKNIKFTPNLDEVIDQVKCVIIATPANSHYKLAKYCLKKGKHILVEKPLSLSDKDSAKLTRLATERNLILMVGFTVIYTPGVKYIKDLINQKKIGNIYYLYGIRTNLGIVRNDCNVIHDLTTHDIATILFLLEDMPIWVSANGESYLGKNNQDIAFVTLGFKNNIIVNLYTSWIDCHKKREIVLITDQMRISFDDTNIYEPVKIYNKNIIEIKNSKNFLNKDIYIPHIQWVEPLKEECVHFHNCITQNTGPITSGEFGYKVDLILSKIMESLATSMKIYLN